MNLMTLSSILAILIPTLVYIMAWFLAQRSINDREKSSSFECGFDLKNSARIPFSTRFFLLAIIFIVFDIEIVLLAPMPLILYLLNKSVTLIICMTFLMILLIGLIYEWKEGSLDWMT